MGNGLILGAVAFLVVIIVIVVLLCTGALAAAPAPQNAGTRQAAPAPSGDDVSAAKMEIPTLSGLTGVDASSFTVGSVTDRFSGLFK